MSTSFEASAKRWGDEAAEEEYGENTPYETDWDENGRKTVVDFKTRPDGSVVKITKTVKAVKKTKRVNKNVERRRRLNRFGECAGKPMEPETGVTMVGQSVDVILPFKKSSAAQSKAETDVTAIALKLLQARLHPEKPPDPSLENVPMELRLKAAALLRRNEGFGLLKKDRPAEEENTKDTGGRPGKYVPPSKRYGNRDGGSSSSMMDESPTIRVTNLSEAVTEAELRDLFGRFGTPKRVYLAKDRETMRVKGYGFVTYQYREEAEIAMRELKGAGLHHLILNLEWAKPRN